MHLRHPGARPAAAARRQPPAAHRGPVQPRDAWRDALDFGGPAAKVTPNAKAAVNFDIFVNVIESGAGLRIDCDYNTDLFDEATIARWMTHYRRILEGICAAPETPLSALPVLSAEQERFVLDVVNDSAAPYPARKLHPRSVRGQQAAKTPDAVACIDGAGAMSYAELDRQSTRLAQEILGVSIVRRGRIAVAVDRSRALPVALLAVMKSGHAYVPLDVHQPLERLRQIATAAADRRHHLPGRAHPVDCALCLCRCASISSTSTSAWTGQALPRVSPDDSAYILFTSGSTGTPKGVEVGHRALTNVICDVVRRCDVTAADVAIASSAITFDVAAAELYAPLIVGGRAGPAPNRTWSGAASSWWRSPGRLAPR